MTSSSPAISGISSIALRAARLLLVAISGISSIAIRAAARLFFIRLGFASAPIPIESSA